MPRPRSKGSKPSSVAGAAGTKVLPQSEVIGAIRRAILADELVPGQRLVEAELCKLLSASRGTVRSALMQLAHEGLVERVANKGARVRVVGIDEALHIVEVREAVETLCIRRAAERVSNKEIAALKELAKKLKDRAEHGDVPGFAELTHSIFELYVRIADQPVAQEILNRLRARNTRHRFRLTYRAGRARVSLPLWLAIVEAICRRDPDAAEVALRKHAQNVRETMKTIAEEQSPFATMYPAETSSGAE